MESHLESDSTRDLHATKSAMPRPRNFLKDYYNQGVSSHRESSKVTKSTEQTNSRYSKDDSWLQRLATEKALDQLNHELLQLKATLVKNEAELQHLSGDRNKIVVQCDELMNMVKQKEALMLKDKLYKFQKALKFPEDGLLDTESLRKNLEESKKFLQDMKRKGIDTQDLGELLQRISPDIDTMEGYIATKNQVESLLDKVKSNIKNNTVDISSSKKLEIPQIEVSDKNYSEFLKEAKDIYGKMIENSMKRDRTKEESKKIIEETLEKGPRCSQLYYAMSKYILDLTHRAFKNFQAKLQITFEEQISKLDEKKLEISQLASWMRISTELWKQ